MYILEALCALAIASLCTDVEAYWYILAGNGYRYRWFTSREKSADKVMKFDDDFPSRKYTGTETVYFKVECDSPVKIRNIKVDVESGSFLLSAESNTSDICSGQTSECVGPKQIQEKQFFISVKPDPEFTGGNLTLKLEQAGKIYLINHKGARFFNKNYVRIYTGYHPVKYSDWVRQYKITCKGNCQIYSIEGLGNNFDISLARYPVKTGKERCTYCNCTTKRDGVRVFCKKNESSSFDMKSPEIYIALDPQGEGKVVLDAEVTIHGGDFKSVEKLDYQNTLLCYECTTENRTAKDCKVRTVDRNSKKTCHVCKLFDYYHTMYPECNGRTKNNPPNEYWYRGNHTFICSCEYDFCNLDQASCKINGTDKSSLYGG